MVKQKPILFKQNQYFPDFAYLPIQPYQRSILLINQPFPFRRSPMYFYTIGDRRKLFLTYMQLKVTKSIKF